MNFELFNAYLVARAAREAARASLDAAADAVVAAAEAAYDAHARWSEVRDLDTAPRAAAAYTAARANVRIAEAAEAAEAATFAAACAAYVAADKACPGWQRA